MPVAAEVCIAFANWKFLLLERTTKSDVEDSAELAQTQHIPARRALQSINHQTKFIKLFVLHLPISVFEWLRVFIVCLFSWNFVADRMQALLLFTFFFLLFSYCWCCFAWSTDERCNNSDRMPFYFPHLALAPITVFINKFQEWDSIVKYIACVLEPMEECTPGRSAMGTRASLGTLPRMSNITLIRLNSWSGVFLMLSPTHIALRRYD